MRSVEVPVVYNFKIRGSWISNSFSEAFGSSGITGFGVDSISGIISLGGGV
jgi:hypothetical protein